MAILNILISGGGIAGPTLAYWLVRAGAKVTIVERSPSLRTAGQTIDIRDAGREVIKRMSLEERILAKTTKEEGLLLVDENNREIARWAAGNESANSFTSEVEIVRSVLSELLYEETKNDVRYIFGEKVESLEQMEEAVLVHFAGETSSQQFDLVVAADGQTSKLRGIAFGPEAKSAVKPLGSSTAYYSMKPGETDTTWSRVYHAAQGRVICVRPDGAGLTRAFLTVASSDPRIDKVMAQGALQQKTLMHDLFKDAGWEMDRLLKGMDEADDFYMEQTVQIKLPSYSIGLVTCVGDAGYAPSAVTGMGTTLAIVGAYVLAGEISKHPNDCRAALRSYEATWRPYVERVQKLPPGVPSLATPQSHFGVSVLRNIAWFIMWSGLGSLLAKVAGIASLSGNPFKLPEYDAFSK